ncbi:MAG TPA: amidohydrolase [Euryarchaeota archaeon]|nr:amidohydrolase [Euryarchaeota archaeon]
MILKGARFVITQDEKRRVLEGADVRIGGDRIREVGRDLKPERGEEVVDLEGRVVLPALINAHNHAPMVLFRGYEDDRPLKEWLQRMWAKEGRLTGRVARAGAKLALLESLSHGIATTLDMYEAEEVAKAALEVGMRVATAPPLISVFAPAEERLKATERFHRNYRGNPYVLPVVNLHSVYTNDEDAIRRAAELSKELNVPLHVHASETREEIYECRKKTGKLPVEYLDSLGAVWERSVLVHLGWVARWEINIMAERGAKAVHCPSSNMKLGTGGFFPYPVFRERGITVGLGTDSAASNNTQDLFREMRMMALIQKHQYWNSSIVTAQDALDVATRGGAEVVGIKAGRIEKGYLADIAVLEITPEMLPLRRENLISNVVYSTTGNLVERVFVGGREVFRRGSEEFNEKYREAMREAEGFLDYLEE